MKTVFASKHRLHHPLLEFDRGEMVDCSELPSRADNIAAAINEAGWGPLIEPASHSLDKISRVHSPDYLSFLQSAWTEWDRTGLKGDVFATNFNLPSSCSTPPSHITGKAGYYFADTSVSITRGTWEAVEQSAHAALTALEIVIAGEKSAFALCRPPGHHASASVGGGYCLLNNAAITAQSFIDEKLGKVAVLDVDYHHGNGTQDIFYKRSDVLYCSLHADPAQDFPYFQGYAHETGALGGEGFNKNYPLPLGTQWNTYAEALSNASRDIQTYAPDLLIVSLGVDTFIDDPISGFKLVSDDYLRMGEKISALNLPTLFIMEGGYNIEKIGINVTNVLKGYLGRS